MNQFAKNLMSLSRTQSRLSKEYARWAAEGGKDAARCAKEADRLNRASQFHNQWAEREMNHD